MKEKKAYAFIKPCGHEKKLIDVAEIHDGTISMCDKTCWGPLLE